VLCSLECEWLLQVIYSDFRRLATQGHVKHVQIDESSGQIFFDAVFSQQKQQAPKKSWIPGRRAKSSEAPLEGTATLFSCIRTLQSDPRAWTLMKKKLTSFPATMG